MLPVGTGYHATVEAARAIAPGQRSKSLDVVPLSSLSAGLAGGVGGGRRIGCRPGARARLPKPAVAAGTDRVPAQDSAADLLRGGRADRRVWGGTPVSSVDRASPRRAQARHPRRRGRALL